MTSANGLIERATRRADTLPLARIVAAMLGAATAFFCFAMPPHVRDGLLAPLGVAMPAGAIAGTLFVLLAGMLGAAVGWLALTLVAAVAAPKAEREAEIDFDAVVPRRRSIGPIHPGEAIGAPLPELLAVRRGDGHPDAPPRRPIFAHELGRDDDAATVDEPGEQAVLPPPATIVDVPAAMNPPETEDTGTAASPAETFDLPDQEPLELVDAIDPAHAKPAADEAPTLAALMARFENGLDRRGGDLRRSADAHPAPSSRPDQRKAEDALREALDALQRMAARQR